MSRGAVRLLTAWAVLMLLLAGTLGAAFLPLGVAKPFVAYGFAGAKAALIAWFFMDMRREPGLARLALASGAVWMGILLVLTATDLFTRGWP